MSTAPAATPDVEEAPAPAKAGGKKKLIIIAAAVLLLAGGGAGAWLMLGAKPAGKDGQPAPAVVEKKTPLFMPLEAFTVNLADEDADRYAQIAITIQFSDSKVDEKLKAVMPVVRNRILMILADKSSRQLITREGKETLAAEIMLETGRAIGWEPPKAKPAANPAPTEPAKAAEGDAPKAEAPAEPPAAPNPIEEVHFSQFIIQ